MVAGVFDAAVQDYDSELLIAAIDDVRALLPNPDARMSLHVNFNDALTASENSAALAKTLPAGLEIRDWTVDHASYFRAIRIEKTMVAIILMLIVAVAAFYLVAMLAMVVTDKRTDIAILRTLGTSPRRVMAIFLIQGSVIAWFGVALGVVLGSLLGHYAGAAAAFLERLFRFEIFSSEVYIVTRIPSELRGDADRLDRRHRHVHHACSPLSTRRSARRAFRRPTRCGTNSMAMNLPYEWLIGTRYLRSTHRSGFVSFVASMSVIGLALGVAVLIVVLSVLNGFERELRSRMLAVTSHATITGVDGEIANWREAQADAAREPGVVAVVPFVESRGLLANGERVAGAMVRGILPEEEVQGGGPRRAHARGHARITAAGQIPHHPRQRARARNSA